MWSNISSFSQANNNNDDDEEKIQKSLSELPESKPIKAQDAGSPLMRYKHAACASSNGFIYIHGGRSGNLPLDDDIWRFDAHQNSWLQLQTLGCKPPSLQEHTMVEFQQQLYLFGGQVSASNTDNNFWRLDLATQRWQSLSVESSKLGAHLGPTNRRGHSAIIHEQSMYIYGGFEDFRGSSGQLWEFQINKQRWELRNLSSSSNCHPEPRHSHSAVVFNDSMFVYGGLSNLKPLSDLWRWSWQDKRWYRERTKGSSPGYLYGHTAVEAFGSMFVFGGERNGRATRSLWRLNLHNMSWRKIKPKGPKPSPTTWHGAIASPLSILDEANYIVEGDPDFLAKNRSSASENSFANFQQQQMISKQVKLDSSLTHSKSICANLSAVNSLAAQSKRDTSTKRRSRLSFLRRLRKDRTRSSCYELKGKIRASSSASDVILNRHSMSIISPNVSDSTTDEDCPMVGSSNETNVCILDHLDTDIKQMFRRALSPANQQQQAEDDPMSIDATQYETANQLDCSHLQSQRTSYAYATPPSELNTLRDCADKQQPEVMSGFDRRENRPKSEIVQSLIDRADARIKHLYTPFFSQTTSKAQPASGSSREAKLQRNRHRLDKSKRHTIHQTMTYYNLYFSEEKSSPSSDSNQQTQDDQLFEAGSGYSPGGRKMMMSRDADSSSTIRELANSAGAVVAVRADSQQQHQPIRPKDAQSELSLEANSSDSKTLCGDLVNFSQPEQDVSYDSSNLTSTLQNALTARPETTESNCDNTSLSFSVIAEFEEDDMLQFSSPTRLQMTGKRDSPQTQQEVKAEQQVSRDLIGAHKSASSGYDSLSGCDQSNRIAQQPSSLQTPSKDSHEDSSIRTGCSSFDFNSAEISPAESNSRRQIRKLNVKNETTSSTTADSLVLTSEDSNQSSSHRQPATSFPSSPPEMTSTLR